jgi:hypothetical protein
MGVYSVVAKAAAIMGGMANAPVWVVRMLRALQLAKGRFQLALNVESAIAGAK